VRCVYPPRLSRRLRGARHIRPNCTGRVPNTVSPAAAATYPRGRRRHSRAGSHGHRTRSPIGCERGGRPSSPARIRRSITSRKRPSITVVRAFHQLNALRGANIRAVTATVSLAPAGPQGCGSGRQPCGNSGHRRGPVRPGPPRPMPPWRVFRRRGMGGLPRTIAVHQSQSISVSRSYSGVVSASRNQSGSQTHLRFRSVRSGLRIVLQIHPWCRGSGLVVAASRRAATVRRSKVAPAAAALSGLGR
jgi:hypothetical protein